MKNNFYTKSYGRRRGRKNKFSLNNYRKNVGKYLFNNLLPITRDIIVEIGSGNGENTIKLAKLYSDKLIIACDVYIDGNASLLSKLIKEKINNVKILEKNCLLLFDEVKKNSIQEIWLLYPDPWPKRKHYKRKLINDFFLKKLNYILKGGSKIYIATDDNYYFIDILLKFYNSKFFYWENDRPPYWSIPFRKMAETSFFLKAQKTGQKSNFMIFSKKI